MTAFLRAPLARWRSFRAALWYVNRKAELRWGYPLWAPR